MATPNMPMEDEAKVYLAILGALTIYLPLMWTWIRSALLVTEKIDNENLENPRAWYWVCNLIPVLTMTTLIYLIFSAILYINGHKFLALPFGAFIGLVGLMFGALATALTTWVLIRTELLAALEH